ncbi:PEPxxWA-CTERM sorting domain-containing protein [Sphingomonas sp. JC676]|uniref:PEPxxWA-CTERM sorting domain-containing protein n=1 Tax=Sphingomonas sp. JC676 TaxID=2768065 RepID=UPI0016583555|nr:PEPxxWA-CTERM sorting domain-containing protein [Sphingomonas sp. JC676]MBC9032621.1 PEPxxWA-CTERM sorting domain-containing protein [Sphingomonas sp. JC676]
MLKKMMIAAALASACGSAHAQITDDFNRPNGTGLGPNYTNQASTPSILGGKAITTFTALSTYNDSSSTTASVDVALRGFDSGSYVALALGYLSGSNYFIKVQDNDGDGWFDSYGFYTGNNGFLNGIQPLNSFQSGNMSVSYAGTVANLLITTAWGTQSYSYDYGFTPGSLDVGLGINRQGVADNLTFAGTATGVPGVPEPAAWAMMLTGFGAVGIGVRSRRRGGVAHA